MDVILDAATRLSQGSATLILAFILLISFWFIKFLLDNYFALSNRGITAIEAHTQAVREQTRSIDASIQAAVSNKAAVDGLKDLIVTWMQKR